MFGLRRTYELRRIYLTPRRTFKLTHIRLRDTRTGELCVSEPDHAYWALGPDYGHLRWLCEPMGVATAD